jgi:hypothetical protein
MRDPRPWLSASTSIEEEVIGEDDDPTQKVTVPGASAQRTLIYTDAEAEAICTWAYEQPGTRWVVGSCILPTFRYTGLRLHELCSWTPSAWRRSSSRPSAPEHLSDDDLADAVDLAFPEL